MTTEYRYVPLVATTSRSFPHSRLVTGFGTRLTRRVPLSGAGTAYPSGAPEFTPRFLVGFVSLDL